MKVRHSPMPNGEKRTDKDLANQWKTIDWEKTESIVNRLQTRIAKAICERLRVVPPKTWVVKCLSGVQ